MRKPTPVPADLPSPGVAYSYIRFSTPDQADGDSLRRQTAATDEWCRRNGVRLDTATTLHDLGKSAFTKKRARSADADTMAAFIEPDDLVNADRRGLAAFHALIKQRSVPRGAFLVIENLDRLSRDDLVPATHLLTGILLAGVQVVQLKPVEQVITAKSGMHSIMLAVFELARGHGESAIKSERVASAWAEKRREAREDGELLTRRLPSWVEVIDGRPELVTERAEVVRRIFHMAAGGYGLTSLVKKLTAERVPAFGVRELGANGRYKAKKGVPFGSGEWNRAYIAMLLRDRRAVGELQPRTADGKPDGPPLVGYLPAVVTEAEWLAARGAAGRKRKQGRIGNGVANVFGGLLFDALGRRGQNGEPATYHCITRVEGDKRHRVLVNTAAPEGKATSRSFPLATFERAVLGMLQELDPREVLGRAAEPDGPAVIQGELDWLREKKAALAAELLNGDVSALAAALRQLEARERELAAKLDDAKERDAKPMADTWREATDLAALLDAAPDKEDVRLRLRSAIGRIIDSIHLIVVPHGRDRLCQVQIWFAGGKDQSRDYLIIYRPRRGNAKASQPARYYVNSEKNWNAGDLRDRHDAEAIEECFVNYPPGLIDQLLASDGAVVIE